MCEFTVAALVPKVFAKVRATSSTVHSGPSSNLVALGTSIRDAQELLGHDDPRMLLGVYAQTTETGRRAAVDGVSATLGLTDSRQRTLATDGRPPRRAPPGATDRRSHQRYAGLQRVEVRGIEPLASTVRLTST